MFFEHIFRSSAFLTVFALFPAFSTSQVFCDSLRFFEHISSYFENREEVLSELREFPRETKIFLEAMEEFLRAAKVFFRASPQIISLGLNYLNR
ncbi:MAG: hypothetical protein UHE93_06880 [Muribaculaceae bacterium]|nr:hypothetical protein [Muribaculaceae bacterium]